MSSLRPFARTYLLAIVVVAFLGMLGGLTVDRDLYDLGPSRWLLAMAFVPLVAISTHYSLDFTFKTKITLDYATIFAVSLLFPPGVAMLIVGIADLITHLIDRDVWYEALFNTAQRMLQAGVAATLLLVAGWQSRPLLLDQLDQVVLIPFAAASIYLVNSAVVAGIVGLQTGLSSWQVWRQSVSSGQFEDVSQFILGLLAAAMVDAYVWALPLFLLPGFAVYLSMQRHVQLRRQTVDAVEALADIVDLRDPYTASHSRRVALYAREIAIMLGSSPGEVDLIERAARVHDVGKLVIDQMVLSKPGRLTDDEWTQLRQHPITGADILTRFPTFAIATAFVRHHHERMDGRGYPGGLLAGNLPLGSRIIAVADAFDAMASARPYREALPRDVVQEELRAGRGTQWDAEVIDALLSLIEQGRVVVPDATASPVLYDRGGQIVPLPTAV